MLLVTSVVLALLPLLGIVWIVFYGTITTVDGLFNSLILLSISGILILNVPLLRRAKKKGDGTASRSRLAGSPGGLTQKGRIESVQFFESSVGQPPKSVVSLADGSSRSNLLVFEGDLRNALPEGRRVEIAFRKAGGANVLLGVTYS
jgi:hypothetical protein